MATQPPWAISVTPKTKHDLHPDLVTGASTGIASGSGLLTDRTIDRHVTKVAPDLYEEAPHGQDWDARWRGTGRPRDTGVRPSRGTPYAAELRLQCAAALRPD